MEARQALTKQIFQLSYHGRVSAEYCSGLEISERNFMYKLLKEQLDAENKAGESNANKAASQTASMRNRMNQLKKR